MPIIFHMNGRPWRVEHVPPGDPMLVDRTGRPTLAVTDPLTGCVYISNALTGDTYDRVLIHELGHCAISSYGLTSEIHRYVKRRYWIEAEEALCNYIADYGRAIFDAARVVRHRHEGG